MAESARDVWIVKITNNSSEHKNRVADFHIILAKKRTSMIGPRKKNMPDRMVCDHCDSVKSIALGGTPRFPKKRSTNYCIYFTDGSVRFIKGYPYTPKWCPAMKGQNNQSLKNDSLRSRVS